MVSVTSKLAAASFRTSAACWRELVGVEDGDERDFRQVESLAQEVDADEHVELAFAERAQNLDAFDGVNLAVEVADVDADLAKIIGELLGAIDSDLSFRHPRCLPEPVHGCTTRKKRRGGALVIGMAQETFSPVPLRFV